MSTQNDDILDSIEKQKRIRFPSILRKLYRGHDAVGAKTRLHFEIPGGPRLELHEQDGWEPSFLRLERPGASDFFFVQLNPSSPAYGKVWWMDHEGPARRGDRLVANSVEELVEKAPRRLPRSVTERRKHSPAL